MPRYIEFIGCWDRIARAQAHSDALAAAWSDLAKDDAYAPTLTIEDDGTGSIWIEMPYDPLPGVFSLELGEFLYQLRAALDGAIYACAIRDSGQDPPPNCDRLEFPVCDSRATFDRVGWKIAPLAPERKRIVESIQPYNVKPDLRPEYMIFSLQRALRILHDWARLDRHRQLHVVGAWASNAEPLVYTDPPARLSYVMVKNDGLLEHDCEIATFKIEGYSRGMEVRANPCVAIDLAVAELPTPCADNDTLGNRIKGMLILVRTVVGGLDESFSKKPTADRIEG